MNHGVFMTFGGGTISFANKYSDRNRIIDAAEEVAREMALDSKPQKAAIPILHLWPELRGRSKA
jgi:hypothetical protein